MKEISERIPIVVAMDSETEEELRNSGDPELQQLKKAGLEDIDQIITPKDEFTGKEVSYGLARLACDTRRMPLLWWAYPSRAAVNAGRSSRIRTPTLAFSAAGTLDAEIPVRLKALTDTDTDPFTSFLEERQFKSTPATDLICRSSEAWVPCNETRLLSSFRGRVVVVAERSSDRDQHYSVLGKVPGYVLQANYIESLLDDRYFRPLKWYWELFFTAVCAAVLVVLFETSSSLLRGTVAALGFIVIIIALCNLIGMYVGIFLIFWVPLLLIFGIELVATWLRHTKPPKKQLKLENAATNLAR